MMRPSLIYIIPFDKLHFSKDLLFLKKTNFILNLIVI